MSDVARGPGWWRASDGKWYPPELHPSRQPPPPSPMWPAPGQVGAPYGYGPVPWGAPYRPVFVDSVLRQPLAPWWKRPLAILIDGAVVGAAEFVVLLVVAIAANHSQTTPSTNNTASAGAVVAGLVFLVVVLSIPAGIYYGAMNGSRRGQTLGKMALNIAVRDANYGSPIGFGRAFGRYMLTVLFTILLWIPAILDYLWPLWDGRRQSWHDKAVHSVVVDLRP